MTQDTGDPTSDLDDKALAEAVRTEARGWIKAGQGKRALRLHIAADRLQSLSERIAVLEAAADHLLHRVPIEPGMNREPFERLRISLTLGGNG